MTNRQPIKQGDLNWEDMARRWVSDGKPALFRYANVEYLVNWETSPNNPIFVFSGTYDTSLDHKIDPHYSDKSF